MVKAGRSGVTLAIPLLFFATVCFPQSFLSQIEQTGSFLNLSFGSGARAFGMGGAFIAVADDATAASWNPAGLCVLAKPEASLVWKALDRSAYLRAASVTQDIESGSSVVISTVRQEDESISGSTSAFDFVSATYPLTISAWKLVPQFSYQRVLDLGAELESRGGFLGYRDLGQSISSSHSFRTVSQGGIDIWTGSLGFSFHRQLYFGFSLNRWREDWQSEFRDSVRGIRCTEPEICVSENTDFQQTVKETSHGFNVNIGALIKPTRRLAIGAVYKTPFTMDHELDIRSVAEFALTSSKERGVIRWPKTVGIGFAFLPVDTLTLSTDYTWSEWSQARYDFHSIDFSDDFYFSDSSVVWPSYSTLSQNNTYQYRLGGEYAIVRNFIVPIRGGFFVDRQFFMDLSEQRAPVTFFGWTAGSGVTWNHISFDVALIHQFGEVAKCDSITPVPGSNFFQVCKADKKDSFRSNRVLFSAIYRH